MDAAIIIMLAVFLGRGAVKGISKIIDHYEGKNTAEIMKNNYEILDKALVDPDTNKPLNSHDLDIISGWLKDANDGDPTRWRVTEKYELEEKVPDNYQGVTDYFRKDGRVIIPKEVVEQIMTLEGRDRDHGFTTLLDARYAVDKLYNAANRWKSEVHSDMKENGGHITPQSASSARQGLLVAITDYRSTMKYSKELYGEGGENPNPYLRAVLDVADKTVEPHISALERWTEKLGELSATQEAKAPDTSHKHTTERFTRANPTLSPPASTKDLVKAYSKVSGINPAREPDDGQQQKASLPFSRASGDLTKAYSEANAPHAAGADLERPQETPTPPVGGPRM